MKNPALLIATMCAAEVLSMLGISSFAALLPVFAEEWALSNTNAGLIGGLYFAGYVVAVPVLSSLTDRIDVRIVYFGGMTTTGLALLGFALTAEGFWSAAAWQVLAGAGLAGTYMPGLKALGDRFGGRDQSRAVAFYTGSFAIGMSLSYLVAGEVARAFDWRMAFGIAALGSLAAMAIAGFALAGHRTTKLPAPDTHLLDFRPVFANRAAMGYVFGYAAHIWELFGLRAWLVAFLVFGASLDVGSQSWLKPTLVATIFMLIGAPASVLGNELCLRFGRRRMISAIMLTSAGLSCVIGFLGTIDYGVLAVICLAYGALLMADSASLTAGMVESAAPAYRGATMAVHSTLGFVGAAAAPPVFGLVLDFAGGRAEPNAWGFAFISLGVVAALGPIALAMGARRIGGNTTSR
ncbi:MAG: MFS transporter [Alphaproteobacteria bacterium]|nr:MFS transporter [Alphaproteobacteria bacterium]